MTFRRSVIPLERSGSPTWQALPQPLIRAVRQPQSAFGRPAAHRQSRSSSARTYNPHSDRCAAGCPTHRDFVPWSGFRTPAAPRVAGGTAGIRPLPAEG